jgi:hypothetical protein
MAKGHHQAGKAMSKKTPPKKHAKSAEPKLTPKQALERMNEELRSRCEKLREELADKSRPDVLTRYRLGELVKQAGESAEKYGKGAVEQVARAFGLDSAVLYNYANVAKVWTHKEVEERLGSAAEAGVPLSITHLVRISSVEKVHHEKLFEAIQGEGLSVKELSRRIVQLTGAGEGAGAISLGSFWTAGDAWLKQVKSWDSELPDLLTPDRLTAARVKHLVVAVQNHRAVLKALPGVVGLVEEALGELQKKRSQATEGKKGQKKTQTKPTTAKKLATGRKPAAGSSKKTSRGKGKSERAA